MYVNVKTACFQLQDFFCLHTKYQQKKPQHHNIFNQLGLILKQKIFVKNGEWYNFTVLLQLIIVSWRHPLSFRSQLQLSFLWETCNFEIWTISWSCEVLQSIESRRIFLLFLVVIYKCFTVVISSPLIRFVQIASHSEINCSEQHFQNWFLRILNLHWKCHFYSKIYKSQREHYFKALPNN